VKLVQLVLKEIMVVLDLLALQDQVHLQIIQFQVYKLQIDTSTTSITITLPTISLLTNNSGSFYIVDVGGNLSNNNAIINISGTNTIVGTTSYVMNINYESVYILSNKNNKWLVL